MGIVQRLLDKFRRTGHPSAPPPVIHTKFGAPVPEWARAQAETNCRLDPHLRARVVSLLIKEAGGDEEAGRAEFRRRYPKGGL
jgi:hypothetical protein